MNQIQIVIDVLLLGALAYLLLHQAAANCFELATFRVLPLYKVPLVVRECLGAIVRRYHKLPTYSGLDNAEAVLKLDDTTGASVLAAYRLLEAQMLTTPWAYPESQHEAVTYVAWEFNINQALRENCEFFRRALNRTTLATRLQET